MGEMDAGGTDDTETSDTTMDESSSDDTDSGETDSETGTSTTDDTDSTSDDTDGADTGECSWIRFGENVDDDVKAVTADTWIDEENPTANNGDDDDLRADGISNQGLTETLFVRFDVSSMPDGVVTDAIFYLSTNEDEGSESSPGSQFSLYAVGEPWDEAEATWVEASAGAPWSVPGCTGAPCRGDTELSFFEPIEQNHTYAMPFDPTIAEAWRDDPISNYGLLLSTPAENGGHFHSSEGKDDTMRPALEVLVCS
jgi:hypothetical protein